MTKASAALLICCLFSSLAEAAKPLWEAGAGLVGFHQPHYLGSDQTRNIALPIPYLIYRGERFRADRSGLRGILFDNQRLELDVSFSGSLPVDSENNDLREDMPDLRPIIEMGPSLVWHVLPKKPNRTLKLMLPYRAAFSIGGDDTRAQGWVSSPELRYSYFTNGSRLRLSIGALLSGDRLQNYFYGVEQQYATSERPFYDADTGLSAYTASASFRQRRGNIIWGAFMNYYDLSDAENRSSPLLVKDDNFTVGLRISWVFAKSSTLVDDIDE